MMFPKKEIVERIRKEYPKGTRVRLIKMDDMQAPPLGTEGTVIGVDDTGSKCRQMYQNIAKNIHLFCLNDLIYMPFRVIYIHNKKGNLI